MTSRLRILVSAYACSPYQGSEPGVGWGFVSELARHHELWVIVEEEKFRSDIERYLADCPDLSKSVHFFFIPKQRNRLLRKIWPPSYYWFYRRWHEDALELAKRLHSEVKFDLVHQLTMVGFREPGYLWNMKIPFVWGPIGGMGRFPWRFMTKVGFHGALYYFSYNILNWCQSRLLSRPRLAAKAAGKALISATPENQSEARALWGCESTVMTEVGLPRKPKDSGLGRNTNEPLRIVWSGLHIERKALNLGLEALAKLPSNVRCELHILGSGPLTNRWQALAVQLGIGDKCIFYGVLPRDRALSVMESAHLMLITSLRDLTSTVTIEAMALGVPVVCLDHCGFSHVVNETCGIKVPVVSPRQVVTDIAAAIERIDRDEQFRRSLASGALVRAKDFSFENKIALLNRVYEMRISEDGTQ